MMKRPKHLFARPSFSQLTVLEKALERERQKNRWLTTNLETYRRLVENLNDIVYATDTRGIITYVSPNVKALGGYEVDEFIGKHFIEFVHPEDRAQRKESFAQVLKGQTLPSEYRFVMKSGQEKWFRTHARPIYRNDKVIGVQGVLVDITERKGFEQALKSSEEKYRQLVENAQDAIVVIQDGRICYANPVAEEIAETSHEQLFSRSIWNFIHPEDQLYLRQRYQKRLEGKIYNSSFTCRLLTGKGRTRFVDFKAVTIEWKDRPAMLCIIRDKTIQKELEQKLQNAHKLESIGTLAGGIAHNFNNLLMGIQGNLSLAMMDLDSGHPARIKLKVIENLVFSGSKLTSQLLGYARGGRYSVQEVDLNSIIREVGQTLEATRKDIVVSYYLDPQLKLIKADQSQMEQMMFNLLLNSADAMPNGGNLVLRTSNVKMSLNNPDNQFWISQENYILLQVSDTGIGMDKATCKRIFEPFFTTKEMGRGTGLGLASVYGIIKGHHGHIEPKSKPNAGTTFNIYLPALEKEIGSINIQPADASPPLANRAAGTIKPLIMIIDDEEIVLEVTAEIIQELGYEVITAGSGQDAIELFRQHKDKISLVILDLVMPRISGEQVFHAIRSMAPGIKVILASGFDQKGKAADLLEKGCSGFLQKPFDADQLNHMIQKAIN